MKKLSIFGIILSIGLIVAGIFLPVPPKKIDVWHHSANSDGYYEYVGGDGYNIQIEASLRGGIIAGHITAKVLLISIGILQLFLSSKAFAAADSDERKIGLLNKISEDLTDIKKELKQEKSQSSSTGKMIFDIQKDISDIKEELLSNLGEDYIIPSIDDE